MAINLPQAIAALEKRSASLYHEVRKYPKAKKFFTRTTLIADSLRQKSSQILASAGLIGTLLTSPIITPPHDLKTAQTENNAPKTVSKRLQLLSFLQENIPHSPHKYAVGESTEIEKKIYESTNIKAVATLEDQALNHQIGYIGYEQHLTRFPGDSISQHDEYLEAGMAPGRGAFGYFAKDASTFTTKDYQREKYYCVVQTLYLENWSKDHIYLKDWYKFRKMLLINPANGQAVVCDIADAGPAEWTGKQFGGSPEVMADLDLHEGPRKGLVIMLFVDDPDNLVPLGPVNY